jgi:hypothetical protein
MPELAKDLQTGFVVWANDGIKKRKYMCMCPDPHPVCFRQGEKNVPHFAHIPVRGPDGEVTHSCRSGGESEEHMMAKHKLVELQGQYSFCLKTCKVCQTQVMEDCKNGTLKIEVQSDDKHWRYDVLYTRHDDGTKLALEVYHTHATGDPKIRSSMESGVSIAEFDAGAILSMHAGTVLDNKLDCSWICSDECQTVKHNREMAAREHTRKKQQEIADAKKQLELEAKRQAQMRKQQQETEAKRARTCTAENYPVFHYYYEVPWNSPYAIVNNGRTLSYGHPPKPELTLENHPLPSFDAKFDYTVPIMGQPPRIIKEA